MPLRAALETDPAGDPAGSFDSGQPAEPMGSRDCLGRPRRAQRRPGDSEASIRRATGQAQLVRDRAERPPGCQARKDRSRIRVDRSGIEGETDRSDRVGLAVDHHGLCPAFRTELVHGVREMARHGRPTDSQTPRDLGIRAAAFHEAQHLALASCQSTDIHHHFDRSLSPSGNAPVTPG